MNRRRCLAPSFRSALVASLLAAGPACTEPREVHEESADTGFSSGFETDATGADSGGSGITEGDGATSGGDDTAATEGSETSTTGDDGGATDAGASETMGGDAGEETTTGGTGPLDPPAGMSSGGSGGGAAAGDLRTTPTGVTYRMIAPGGAGPHPTMIVYSGTEGGAVMTNNISQVAGFTGTGSYVFAVLDGVQYNGNGAAGAEVLDDVRSLYDVDNDRTYLLSESAGTSAGLELGLSLRQGYFAAYWANDVNASASPALTSTELGFEPWGNAGPGGAWAHADAIVAGMELAGYRAQAPAPYDGPGAGTHGSPDQFVAAMQWFPGKSRQ